MLESQWIGHWSGKSPLAGSNTGCSGTYSGYSLLLPYWGCTSAERLAICLSGWTWSGCRSGGGMRVVERSRSPVQAPGAAQSTAQKGTCR